MGCASRALLIVVALGATASADPVTGDSWLELGVLRARIAMPDGHQVEGFAASFSPRVRFEHNFYAGAELDRGHVEGSITTPAAFRETGIPVGPTSDVIGDYTSLRMLVGVRARSGVISAGGELAAGFHHEEFTDPQGQQIAIIEANSTQLEARARVDLWITPQVSLGAVVGADDGSDLAAGLVLGLHIGHYDDGSAPVR